MGHKARTNGFNLPAALERVRGHGPALVLMHDNPDPDSMAAAECMRVLLESAAGLEVTVARGGIIGRAENRAMVAELKLDHTVTEDIDFSDYGVIAMVDTQPETGNNQLPRGHRIEIVIDHHPIRPESRRAAWCDIRDNIGASSTITYTYLRQMGIPITKKLATALLYAIRSETQNLVREASRHEHEAYSQLLEIADLDKLHRIAEPKVPVAHFASLDKALRRARVRGNLLSVNLGQLSYPDLVAEIADLLLPYQGTRWVMCVGWHDNAAYLSLRTDEQNAKAGRLIRTIVGDKGAAGGHGAIAGGKMFTRVENNAELAPIFDELVEAMARELDLGDAATTPLLLNDDMGS